MRQKKKSIFFKEMVFILGIKLLLLYSVWQLCFRGAAIKADPDHFANTLFGWVGAKE